jgi:transcriptional regulator with XRE-family HTH domain
MAKKKPTMPEFTGDFPARLRAAMDFSGLRQNALAEKAEFHQGYLSELLAGKSRLPSIAHAARLARALGVPLESLVPDESTPR